MDESNAHAACIQRSRSIIDSMNLVLGNGGAPQSVWASGLRDLAADVRSAGGEALAASLEEMADALPAGFQLAGNNEAIIADVRERVAAVTAAVETFESETPAQGEPGGAATASDGSACILRARSLLGSMNLVLGNGGAPQSVWASGLRDLAKEVRSSGGETLASLLEDMAANLPAGSQLAGNNDAIIAEIRDRIAAITAAVESFENETPSEAVAEEAADEAGSDAPADAPAEASGEQPKRWAPVIEAEAPVEEAQAEEMAPAEEAAFEPVAEESFESPAEESFEPVEAESFEPPAEASFEPVAEESFEPVEAASFEPVGEAEMPAEDGPVAEAPSGEAPASDDGQPRKRWAPVFNNEEPPAKPPLDEELVERSAAAAEDDKVIQDVEDALTGVESAVDSLQDAMGMPAGEPAAEEPVSEDAAEPEAAAEEPAAEESASEEAPIEEAPADEQPEEEAPVIATEPEAAEPEAEAPEAFETDHAEPEAFEPEATEPDATETDSVEPAAIEESLPDADEHVDGDAVEAESFAVEEPASEEFAMDELAAEDAAVAESNPEDDSFEAPAEELAEAQAEETIEASVEEHVDEPPNSGDAFDTDGHSEELAMEEPVVEDSAQEETFAKAADESSEPEIEAEPSSEPEVEPELDAGSEAGPDAEVEEAVAEIPLPTEIDPAAFAAGASAAPEIPPPTEIDPAAFAAGASAAPEIPPPTEIDPAAFAAGESAAPEIPPPTEIDPAAFAAGESAAPEIPPPTEIDPAAFAEGGAPAIAPPQEIDPAAFMAAEAGGAPEIAPPQEIDPAAFEAPADGGMMELTPEQMAALLAEDVPGEDDWGAKPLSLPPEKAELVMFMVSDLRESYAQLPGILTQMHDSVSRGDTCETLANLTGEMMKSCEFFEFKSLKKLLELLGVIAEAMAYTPDEIFLELHIRLAGIISLLDQHASGLEVGMEINWPLDLFEERINILCRPARLHPEIVGWHNNDADRLLELDFVSESIENPPRPESSEDPVGGDLEAEGGFGDRRSGKERRLGAKPENDRRGYGVPTIRVTKTTVEELMDIARQLVMSKNRLTSLSRRVRDEATIKGEVSSDTTDDLMGGSEELNRLVGQLQIAVMQTRMQRIDKTFERYTKVIRDVARINNKEIDLELEGVDTQVDKFLIEELVDPITTLLRKMAREDLEEAEERVAAGKPETGKVILTAANQGSHVVITVRHDGRPLNREGIIAKAIECGQIQPAEAERLDDSAVFALTTDFMHDGSPLAEIGYQLEAINADVSCGPDPMGGYKLEIAIPLSAAVIPAMMVRLSEGYYAVPLQNILEIVKVDKDALHEVNGRPVMRLREQVIGVIDMHEALHVEPQENDPAAGSVAVVINTAGVDAVLQVDQILGQQEVVIEHLDGQCNSEGPFSGATIRDDGGVSLIIDTMRLTRRYASELNAAHQSSGSGERATEAAETA